jgi:hypothetical protein
MQLIRRFSAAAVLAELLEARMVNGEEINSAELALLTSSMVRVAQRIGIDRIAKTLPSLDQYLASKKSLEAEADEDEDTATSAAPEPDRPLEESAQ